MKAEKLLRVVEVIKGSNEFQSGTINFTADVIDLNKELQHSYSVQVFSTDDNTAFYDVQLASYIEQTCLVAVYFRITRDNKLQMQII